MVEPDPQAPRQAGRSALVTGGARGLGAAIVRRLHADGAHVTIADIRSEDGEALAAELGERACYAHLDVTSEDDWSVAVETVVRTRQRLDVLVNNAGIGGMTPITTATVERFRKIVDVNQIGVFLGMREALRVMIAAGRGSVVNISSVEGVRGMAGFSAYCGSKHAVVGMSRAASLEVAEHGVRINVVCPGAVSTPGLLKAIGGAAAVDKLAAHVPLGRRLSDPSEVAAMVAFLASDDASYCTGADFAVDGGWTAGVT